MYALNDTDEVPAPTSARQELPTLDVVETLGLELGLDEARLVLVALSGAIGSGRSKSRDKVSQMTRGLLACCHVDGFRDGEPISAAHSELPEFGWPSGRRALDELRIDHRVLETYWQSARRRSTDACLPLEWVLRFVPAPLWPAVLTVIRWGPAEAAWRLEDAVVELARRPLAVKTRRRGAAATLSAGTINTRVTGVHNLFSVLVGLRERAKASCDPGLPVSLLEPWLSKPGRPDVEACGAVWAQVNTAGPSIEQAQALLRRLDSEAAAAPAARRYLKLRRRVIAGLLLAHGPRIDALHRLDVADYLPNHNFGDGTIGPALVYRPGKTRASDDQHILSLPDELATWLEEWVEATGRTIGEQDSPLWPHRKPKPSQPIKRLNASAFARLVSGHAAKDGTGATPLLQRGDSPYYGYNPHSYRHTCYRTMRRAGAQALLAQAQLYLGHTPDDFARAVVGHDLIRSVGDLYRDLDQQHLARVAIEYGWEELRRKPIRCGPDPAAIDEASQVLELLNNALGELAAELSAQEQQQAAITKRLAALSGDRLEAARIESSSLAFQLARLQIAIAAGHSRRQAARSEVEQRLNEDCELELAAEDEYEQELGRARARAERALAHEPFFRTKELGVRQFSAIVGTSRKTINSWIRHGIPAGRPQLWNAGVWTRAVDGSWRLCADALNESALSPIQHERLLVVLLRPDPSLRSAA
jgi:integrase